MSKLMAMGIIIAAANKEREINPATIELRGVCFLNSNAPYCWFLPSKTRSIQLSLKIDTMVLSLVSERRYSIAYFLMIAFYIFLTTNYKMQ